MRAHVTQARAADPPARSAPPATAGPERAGPDPRTGRIHHLQRALGNQVVQRAAQEAPPRITPLPGGAPVLQRSPVSTHYGTFEDADYHVVQNRAGTDVGVEMLLKFHPNANVNADWIGLTQAARAMLNGKPMLDGLAGARSATAGPGKGTFIDQNAGNPNPLYAGTSAVRPGGDPGTLAGYGTSPPVAALTPAEQKADADQSGIVGRRYSDLGQHGFHSTVNARLLSRPAVLHDVPVMNPSGPSSEQVFETTALAIEGVQKGTYYGSVQWGWKKDALGKLAPVPLSKVSEGAPSAAFLTAAAIWNQSRTDLAMETTATTGFFDPLMTMLETLQPGTLVDPTDKVLTHTSGKQYQEVYRGTTRGAILLSDLRPATKGRETLDLPVPMVHRVSIPTGATLILPTAGGAPPEVLGKGSVLSLLIGTRVMVKRCMAPQGLLIDHYEVEVVDGVNTGEKGWIYRPHLAMEALGTRAPVPGATASP